VGFPNTDFLFLGLLGFTKRISKRWKRQMRKELAKPGVAITEAELATELRRYTSSTTLGIAPPPEKPKPLQTEKETLSEQLSSAHEEIDKLRAKVVEYQGQKHTITNGIDQSMEEVREHHTVTMNNEQDDAMEAHLGMLVLKANYFECTSSSKQAPTEKEELSTFEEACAPTVMKFGGNQVVVSPGNCMSTPVPVSAEGSKLFWTFNMEEKDIDFTVVSLESGNPPIAPEHVAFFTFFTIVSLE
jgi:hypothetical protein